MFLWKKSMVQLRACWLVKLWLSTGGVQAVEKDTGLGDGDCHLSTEGRKL